MTDDRPWTIAISAPLVVLLSASAGAAEVVKINEIVVAVSIPDAQRDATDLVINMSGYPKQRAFPRSDWDKVEDWDVEDPYGADPLVYQRIFEDIRTRIESLTTRLRDTAGNE